MGIDTTLVGVSPVELRSPSTLFFDSEARRRNFEFALLCASPLDPILGALLACVGAGYSFQRRIAGGGDLSRIPYRDSSTNAPCRYLRQNVFAIFALDRITLVGDVACS